MNVELVLQNLQTRFPGQLVLYVKDIAVLLGKSEKALANLISRGSLPFQVKLIGNLRCVDVYQIAQFLATDIDPVEVAEVLKPLPKKNVPPSLPAKKAEVIKARAPTGIALQILQMRHDNAMALSRFAKGLGDPLAQQFMLDVAERIAFAPGAPVANFVVSSSSREFSGAMCEARSERNWYLDSLHEVEALVGRCRAQASETTSMRLTVKRGRYVLFHAVSLNGIWAIKVNLAKFNFRP